MTEDTQTIKKLEQKIELLMKIADKSSLVRHTPQEDIGMEIKVSTYRENPSDKPRLVTGWSGTSPKYGGTDDVRTTKKFGVEENQRTVIFLETDPKVKQGLNAKKATLARTKDEDKIAELEKSIEEASRASEIELNITDFQAVLEKVTVTVKGKEVRDGVTFFIFDWNGQETKLSETFIN